jgi:hypothetical protein
MWGSFYAGWQNLIFAPRDKTALLSREEGRIFG